MDRLIREIEWRCCRVKGDDTGDSAGKHKRQWRMMKILAKMSCWRFLGILLKK